MSMQQQNKLDDYINNHPRESLQLLLMGIGLIWLTPVGILAIVLYMVLSKLCKARWWVVLGVGVLMALLIVAVDAYRSPIQFNLAQYLKDGFDINVTCWKLIFYGQQSYVLSYLYQYAFGYILGMPLLFAGILCAVGLIQESPHQKAITALQKGEPFDLKRVVECLDHPTLSDISREIDDKELEKRVAMLGGYDKKDILGLRAHLNLLVHSELGDYFSKNEKTFSIGQAIAEDAVVYFALPALRFPSFSKVLGKLVINDLKAVIDRDGHNKRVFMLLDEFSVFAGEQVQGLADLNRVDADFKSQVLNCANTIICHRLNDQESAESVSAWMGTQDSFTVTAQFDPSQKGMGLGSVRADKTYIVHPEAIKQGLRTGEAYCVSKVGQFGWEKVRVRAMLG